MGKTSRNAPKRAASSESTYTRLEFDREFVDDATCLDYLVSKLYPDGIFCRKCGKVTRHHRLKNRPAYSCQFCGSHEYPLKGTIFEGSSTSLRIWFQAMYLMASTRCGISAKQLERETGVSYPTAWRMFNRIRALLPQDDDDLFSGTVEMDEAYMGGVGRWKHKGERGRKGRPQPGSDRPAVFGMAQRKTEGAPGKIYVQVVESVHRDDLEPHIARKVLPASTVYTDEWRGYERLGKMGYTHSRVQHTQQVYVSGDVHTQTIEGFWSHLKRGVSGVYHGVSTKHLQSYLDEYVFRYNNRFATGRGMFDAFLSRVRKVEARYS
jgi:transposase